MRMRVGVRRHARKPIIERERLKARARTNQIQATRARATRMCVFPLGSSSLCDRTLARIKEKAHRVRREKVACYANWIAGYCFTA